MCEHSFIWKSHRLPVFKVLCLHAGDNTLKIIIKHIFNIKAYCAFLNIGFL